VRIIGRSGSIAVQRFTGNLKVTALYILIVWIVAAFGEEMITGAI